MLARREDFEERFKKGLELYDGLPGTIIMSFVADDQVNDPLADMVLCALRIKQIFRKCSTCTILSGVNVSHSPDA